MGEQTKPGFAGTYNKTNLRPTASDIPDIQGLFAQGYTTDQVAAAYGVSTSSFKYRLGKLGWKIEYRRVQTRKLVHTGLYGPCGGS